MALDFTLEPVVPACALMAGALSGAGLGDLEQRLGHNFSEPALLARALTHVSAEKLNSRVESYQRLEFLGDRVLGLAIAEMLYQTFPDAEEGELSRRLSALVRKETCAGVARDWDVGPCLILGAGERKGQGRNSVAILGDVCEAILGAVFVDAGFDAARALVRRAFGARLTAPGVTLDPKTALQEWAQASGRPPPAYREVSRGGPAHRPVFVISVEVEGFEKRQADGASKRLAEMAAAQAFIEAETLPLITRRHG